MGVWKKRGKTIAISVLCGISGFTLGYGIGRELGARRLGQWDSSARAKARIQALRGGIDANTRAAHRREGSRRATAPWLR